MSEPTLVIHHAYRSVLRNSEIIINNEYGHNSKVNLRQFVLHIDDLEEAKRELKSAMANDGQRLLGSDYGVSTKLGLGMKIANSFAYVISEFGYVWPLDYDDLAQGKSVPAVYPTFNTKVVDMIVNINYALRALTKALNEACTSNDANAKELITAINAVNKIERRYWNEAEQKFTDVVCVTTYEA